MKLLYDIVNQVSTHKQHLWGYVLQMIF